MSRAVMDHHNDDLESPAPVGMSFTFQATLFVLALLFVGAFLFWQTTGPLIPEIISTIPQSHTPELPTK